MSLPPGFLDELRSRISLTQVVGRKVVWDQRKSNQGRGDMWAPCPFHQEKTASFHVDDRKGYYYCFGCHAKGDAIGFVKDTENVGFMEAVEILAREAGMPMPARDPQAAARAEKRDGLAEIMEQAVRHYRLQLQTGAAATARAYLEQKRRLDAAALERFEIGFAPPGWRGLCDALTARGVPEDQLLAAGLAARKDGRREAYDRFRDRIIFPIRDARGRCIAFGGRAMDPGDQAKYLNSPETALFDKGRSLYNHGPARAAVGKGQALIVAEGYMDVIALARAGFEGAVAPLGTAITENQLALLWRITPEPVIALDGDAAGLRAAVRLIDLALPLLTSGRSLRFALMPPGKDPDDLIGAGGAGAMQKVLDGAKPLIDLLWQRETEGQSFDSPERRAALDLRLRDLTGKIEDPILRQHYGQALKDRRWQLFRGAFTKGGRRKPVIDGPRATTRSSSLLGAGDDQRERLREAVIVALALRNPTLLVSRHADLEDLALRDEGCSAARDALLACDPESVSALPVEVVRRMGRDWVESLLSEPHLTVNRMIRQPGSPDAADAALTEEIAKLRAERGAREEEREALDGIRDEVTRVRDMGADPDRDSIKWRLHEARSEYHRARRGQGEDEAHYEFAENGAPLDRDERAAFRALLDSLDSDGLAKKK